jgi:bifunctional lysine-specific demethylase and histidyl-hydroxylase NO66
MTVTHDLPTPTGGGGGRGGLSRAAQRRAKKKQKTTTATMTTPLPPLPPSHDNQNHNHHERPLEGPNKRHKVGQTNGGVHVRAKVNPREMTCGNSQPPSKKQTVTPQAVTSSSTNATNDTAIDIIINSDTSHNAKPGTPNIPAGPLSSPPTNVNSLPLMDILLLHDPLNKAPTKDDDDEHHKGNKGDNIPLTPPPTLPTSAERAQQALQCLLQPAGITTAEFYQQYWEKQPLHVPAATAAAPQYAHRLDGLWSLQSIRQAVQSTPMYYSRDLNVTRYTADNSGVKRRVTSDPVMQPCRQQRQQGDSTSTSTTLADQFVLVNPTDLWRHYEHDQCTLRFLCPHQHSPALHALLSLLELEWGCMVGANAYLTPPHGAQGFAPHYDDIEAFILQLEGHKRWKVYAPLSKEERLPRTSSRDYVEKELRAVSPVMDIVLGPGDCLYLPRGWIHQACTLPQSTTTTPTTTTATTTTATTSSSSAAATSSSAISDTHSLHVTVSAMQQWAWVDYMELLLPEALEYAASGESTLLRQGMPRCFLDYMGAMYDTRDTPEAIQQSMQALQAKEDKEQQKNGTNDPDDDADVDDEEQEEEVVLHELQEQFRSEAKKRIMRIAKSAMELVDAACDQMGKRFLSDRLPPALTAAERACTSHDLPDFCMTPQTQCRLVRPGIARLVLEDNQSIVYHCNANSLVHHEVALSPLEFEMDDGPAIEQLLRTVEPEWIVVSDLYHDALEDKVGVAQALFDEGILAVNISTHK